MRRSLPLAVVIAMIAVAAVAEDMLVPVIDGPTWQIAGNPDLGKYTRQEQQPVDFGIWQAADGTWQLWSCIRSTGCGGNGRLLYRWEGKNLTDHDWRPMGIAMEARPELGETPGGLQAPHVVRHEGRYVMAYGDWENICFATSRDGKHFERVVGPDGKTGAFGEGPGANARDAMLIQIDGLWHCYYTAFPGGLGYALCRTSPDLKHWGPSFVVCYGGKIGNSRFEIECPFVVEPEPGVFCFLRNQYYGRRARNWVYCSRNPLNFGIDDDSKLVRSWRVAAPEIVHHQGQYYVASLLDDLQGIRLARLKWARVPRQGQPVFDFGSPSVRDAWKLTGGNLASVFTRSKRTDFWPPAEYFIATAEIGSKRHDDALTGVIESPRFTLDANGYSVFVSGGDDARKVYVALIDAETGAELARWTGARTNRMRRIDVDTKASKGKTVLLRVVDRSTGQWGHINFGGIYTNPLADL